MNAATELRRTTVSDDFHKCTACGYSRGFHCSFREVDEKRRAYHVVLICPNCGARYHIGWTVQLDR